MEETKEKPKPIPFKAQIRFVAGSWVVTVPKSYIVNQLVSTEKEYWFEIVEEVLPEQGTEEKEKNEC